MGETNELQYFNSCTSPVRFVLIVFTISIEYIKTNTIIYTTLYFITVSQRVEA